MQRDAPVVLARSATGGDVRARRDWRDWRNDLIASAWFQRFAARFPLTRPIAARRARAAFDLAAGFVYSQTLFACVKLRLLETLQAGPLDAAEIAAATGLPTAGAERLALAAASLGLAERRPGARFGLGPHGAAFLGNPGALAMVEHHHLLYADLADPVALLRGEAGPTRLSAYWAYATSERPGGIADAQSTAYTTLMDRSQELVRQDVLSAFPMARYRALMDVGGGEGGFAAAALAQAPHLTATVFDLPPVAARARARIESLGLSSRAVAVGGDFSADDLPRGADLVSLVRVLHDHDDDLAMTILRKITAALADGGTILLAEPMSDAPGAEPMGAAYLGFSLLAMGSGRPRTRERIAGMLRDAGFMNVRTVKTPRPMLVSILTATVQST